LDLQSSAGKVTARERLITLKINDEEDRRFKAVAEDMGLTVSAMIRALVREREKNIGEKKWPQAKQRSK
jgi:antitoxin component of RelBE/YafQ-DinJ toxin-antitoxin module